MPQAVDTALFCLYLYLRWELIEPTLSETYPQYDKNTLLVLQNIYEDMVYAK